jgi:hypothetical protein
MAERDAGTATRRDRRAEMARRDRTRVIEVSVQLTPVEQDLLVRHFSPYLQLDDGEVRKFARAGYDNFFAVLYRLLEPARTTLRRKLIEEIDEQAARFDDSVRHGLQAAPRKGRPPTPMQRALSSVLAKWLDRDLEQVGSDAANPEAIRSETLGMVNAVMVSSVFGLQVPQSIALRLLADKDRYLAYSEAMRSFRAIETSDRGGMVYTLHARQPLEAEIWCEHRIGQRSEWFEIIRAMVAQLRRDEVDRENAPELEFVIRLLQAIGPQGPSQNQMRDHFLGIAQAVRDLRTRFKVVHPRLLLIESNAVREAIKFQQPRWEHAIKEKSKTEAEYRKQVNEWLDELKQAEESLGDAREVVEAEQNNRVQNDRVMTAGPRRFLSVIETEMACVNGVELGCLTRLAKTVNDPDDGLFNRMDDYLERSMRAWRRALSFEAENFQALDTACWILEDRFKAGRLDEESEALLLATWGDVIDQYRELELTAQEYDKFDNREAALADALKDVDRLERVFTRMERRGTNAIHTLKARLLEREAERKHPGTGSRKALEYLEKYVDTDSSQTDRAVLLLYYRLWWRVRTGLEGFFAKDHLCLKFGENEWRRLAELAEQRLQLEGETTNPMALFHLGWAKLQLGQTARAKEAFHQLTLVSVGSFRRGRTLALVSQPDGTARQYFGETRGRLADSGGLVWVEDLRQEVRYSAMEFGETDTRPGHLIGPLCIALNYRGVFAQPEARLARIR